MIFSLALHSSICSILNAIVSTNDFRYLYSAKLPNHLTSKTELKDLTKLGQRFSVVPVKNFVKLFNADQFDDDEDGSDVKDESVDKGGFIDCPPPEVTEEVVLASATQNLDLLLDALGVTDVTQATQATETSGSAVTHDVDRDANCNDDDDWNEMCYFLTQKRLDKRASSFNEVIFSIQCLDGTRSPGL